MALTSSILQDSVLAMTFVCKKLWHIQYVISKYHRSRCAIAEKRFENHIILYASVHLSQITFHIETVVTSLLMCMT